MPYKLQVYSGVQFIKIGTPCTPFKNQVVYRVYTKLKNVHNRKASV